MLLTENIMQLVIVLLAVVTLWRSLFNAIAYGSSFDILFMLVLVGVITVWFIRVIYQIYLAYQKRR